MLSRTSMEKNTHYHLSITQSYQLSLVVRELLTLLYVRASEAFTDEDLAICEYGATVVGIDG